MSAVRVRNLQYALSGSVDAPGHRVVKYRLEPNVWTEVPDEVYTQLYDKFGNAKYSVAPDALPSSNGEYVGEPGRARPEQCNGQYLIEFRK